MKRLSFYSISKSCAVVLLGLSVAFAVQARAEEENPEGKAAEKPVAAAPKDYVILEVDGEKIHYSTVLKIWSALFPDGSAPEFGRFDEKVRQNVLRGVISEQLIYKQAQASGMENSEKVKDMLDRLKKKLVSQTFLEEKIGADVTDAAVRAEYDKRSKAEKGKKEVHARHILVQEEKLAKELKEQLDDGADFMTLAREKSEDKASGKNGGDLGFFGEKEMIPAFTKAAFALKKGEISDPVNTEFGWHIIRVEETRDAKMPPFAEMRDSIREELKGAALKKYINNLVDTAQVKYFSPEGKEMEFTKVPDTVGAANE